MSAREKWVSLFEKVVGRKPSPDEFMAGKETDFKLTEIRRIAGLEEPTEIQTSFGTADQMAVPTPDEGPEVEVTEPTEASPALDESPEHTESVEAVPVHENEDQEITLVQEEPVIDLAEPTQSVRQEPLEGTVELTRVKKIPNKGDKLKRLLVLAGILLVGLVTAAYFHFKSQTGPEVAAKEFVAAVDSNDYDRVAKLLTTKDTKWDKNQAKSFITYLDEQEIDLEDELDKIVDSGAKTVYNDKNGNKLFSLNEVDKQFGIFPVYQVMTYPLELVVKSNLDDLTVNQKKVEKDKEVSVGKTPFVSTELAIKATTALGTIDEKMMTDLSNAEDNRLVLSLETMRKPFKLNLSEDFPSTADMKLYINGKEQADYGIVELDVLSGQTLEVYAIIDYAGGSYTTEKQTITITKEMEMIEATLELPDNLKEKAASQENDEEVEDKINDFLLDYRDEINYSIENEENTFAEFYDPSSAVYREMVDYTEGGGARRAKVEYHIAGEMTINKVSKDGDHYLVETYETFTQVYTNDSRDQVYKYKTYHLKPVGDSFVIFDIEVTTR